MRFFVKAALAVWLWMSLSIAMANSEQVEPIPLPEMVVIPAGQFEMGCVSGIDCKAREKPVHLVSVERFELSATEVTMAAWQACIADQGCDYMPQTDGLDQPNMPVRYISWDDTQMFIAWLNKKTGESYRLPTESEWEYAARAGTMTPFNTGDCITAEQANYEGNAFKVAGCEVEGAYRKQAMPVASFSPNAFGLYDMHGNMWEWVQDCWHWNYDGAPADGAAWLGSASECERHVMRGGAWHGTVSYMRSAYRFRFPREGRSGGLGFRLARSL